MTPSPVEAFAPIEASESHPRLNDLRGASPRTDLHSYLDGFAQTYMRHSLTTKANLEWALRRLCALRSRSAQLTHGSFAWMFDPSSYGDVFEAWLQLIILQSYVRDPGWSDENSSFAQLCVRTPELGRAEIFAYPTDDYTFIVVPREYILWNTIYGWVTADLLTDAERAGTPSLSANTQPPWLSSNC